MSHITLGAQGIKAADDGDWETAVSKLSAALEISSSPAWLISRSRALVGLKRYREALEDANLAWHSAHQRNQRSRLLDAQYRRAVALYRLGQYANADCCCVYAMRLARGLPAVEKTDPKDLFVDKRGFWMPTLEDAKAEARQDQQNQSHKSAMATAVGSGAEQSTTHAWRRASALRMQILSALQKRPADDPSRKVTIHLKPEEKKTEPTETKSTSLQSSEKSASTPSGSRASASVPHDTPIRIQDFQSKTTMSVSIFSKGIRKDKLSVDFWPQAVRLDPVVYPDGTEAPLQLELWGEIDPSASRHSVTSNKVELSLAKETPGTWKMLFSETRKTELKPGEATSMGRPESVSAPKDQTTSTGVSETPSAPQAAKMETAGDGQAKAEDATKPAGPSAGASHSYPTSSRSGPRDWDKLVGDDNSDDEDGRDVNFFFKKLFKNATPNQQRAMMKSFTESNGTSLSTDWNDVKDRKVETVPPEGVEAKQWEG